MEISTDMIRRPHVPSSTFHVLFAIAIALAFAGPVAAGVVFTQEIRGEGETAKFQNMTMRTWIDTGGAKTEILTSGNPILAAGSYMLIQPDADAILLVNPKEKTYATLDFAAMMGSMSQMMGGGGENAPAPKVADPIVEKLLEEDGGMMLGRPTRHFRWRTRYTMVMSLPMGMGMEIATDQTEDVWVADIKIDPKIMRSFESMGGGAAMSADMQKIVEAAKKTQTGFPMKSITVSKSKSTTTGSGMMAKMMANAAKDQGSEEPTTTTFEVTALSEEKIPASMFSIPAGYTETEMMAPAMKMPDMNQQN